MASIQQYLYEALGLALKAIEATPQPTPREPKGGVTLANGSHVLSVPVDFQPTKVYVSVTDSPSGTSAGGNVSTAGATIEDHNITLYVNVKGDSANVEWVVT